MYLKFTNLYSYIYLLVLFLLLSYFYLFNKNYQVTIKFLSIDNQNFQIIESINQNLNTLPANIKVNLSFMIGTIKDFKDIILMNLY